jgi:hypothetical protein
MTIATAAPLFIFNKNYDDYEQVAEWIGDFARIRQEIVDAGRYPHNASFRGRIPGSFSREVRPGVEGDHEDAAIYLLQGLYREREREARRLDFIAEGAVEIETVNGRERFKRVLIYPVRRMGGEQVEYENVRLVNVEGNRPGGVLLKGARTRAIPIYDRRVLALR